MIRKHPLNFGYQYIDPLRENRPKEYAHLVKTGKLREQAFNHQEAAKRDLSSLMDAGMNWTGAYEQVSRSYLLPPAESEEEDGIT